MAGLGGAGGVAGLGGAPGAAGFLAPSASESDEELDDPLLLADESLEDEEDEESFLSPVGGFFSAAGFGASGFFTGA